MVLLRKNDIGIGLTISVLLSLFVNFTMLGRIYELGVNNRIVGVRPPDRIVYFLLIWFFLVSFILFIVNRLMLHIGDRLFRKKEYKRIALACAVCLVIGLGLYRLRRHFTIGSSWNGRKRRSPRPWREIPLSP